MKNTLFIPKGKFNIVVTINNVEMLKHIHTHDYMYTYVHIYHMNVHPLEPEGECWVVERLSKKAESKEVVG